MIVKETPLAGLLLIEPKAFQDERGQFFEFYTHKKYHPYQIPELVQDNVSRSQKNVLRGLHYQSPRYQGKLVGVIHGEVWDVAVDIRRESPTYGQWFGTILNDRNHHQLYVPPGFAHGFCVLSEFADFYYKCTEYYYPEDERGIAWDDPQLNIPWPVTSPILSAKDQTHPPLSKLVSYE